jgi:cold shock CspA family protein
MSEREFGRIKRWFADKGYGFIRTDQGDDIFVHVSNTGFLVPKMGDRVAFDRGSNPRTESVEAKRVSLID